MKECRSLALHFFVIQPFFQPSSCVRSLFCGHHIASHIVSLLISSVRKISYWVYFIPKKLLPFENLYKILFFNQKPKHFVICFTVKEILIKAFWRAPIIMFLLTELEVCIGESWPRSPVQTKRSEVCTSDQGQDSPVETDHRFGHIIRCLLYGQTRK